VLVALFASLLIVPVNAGAPGVETLPATNVTSTSAVLGIGVAPNGPDTSWKLFFARVGVTFTASTFACTGSATGGFTVLQTFSCSVSGLTPFAAYHYRAAASNADGTSNGAELTFTTLAAPNPPDIHYGGVTDLTATSATIYGSVSANGLATTWQFFAGPDGTRYPQCSGDLPASANLVLVKCGLTGLTPVTAYTWQLHGRNTAGARDTAIQTFSTPAAATPVIVATLTPEILSPTSVRLRGTVNPNGLPTSWDLLYNEIGMPLSGTGAVAGCYGSLPASTSVQSVSCTVSGLRPDTSYHTTLRATNRDPPDWVYGAEVAFTTVSETTTSGAHSDWAVVSIALKPASPQIGQSVYFIMSMKLVSTADPLPQTVEVQCQIDGARCGSKTVTYPGPPGQELTGATDSPWIATAGSHILTWSIAAIDDPNSVNNVMSTTFVVPFSPGQTVTSTTQPTTIQATTSLQSTTAQSSSVTTAANISQSSEMTPETIQQEPSPETAISALQQNSLLVIGALALLAMILAVALKHRKPRREEPEPSKLVGGTIRFCPSCGTANPSTSQFCGKCGTRLE
jgi:hypothetical protein